MAIPDACPVASRRDWNVQLAASLPQRRCARVRILWIEAGAAGASGVSLPIYWRFGCRFAPSAAGLSHSEQAQVRGRIERVRPARARSSAHIGCCRFVAVLLSIPRVLPDAGRGPRRAQVRGGVERSGRGRGALTRRNRLLDGLPFRCRFGCRFRPFPGGAGARRRLDPLRQILRNCVDWQVSARHGRAASTRRRACPSGCALAAGLATHTHAQTPDESSVSRASATAADLHWSRRRDGRAHTHSCRPLGDRVRPRHDEA